MAGSVAVRGNAPRQVGATLAARADSTVLGSVRGGRAESANHGPDLEVVFTRTPRPPGPEPWTAPPRQPIFRARDHATSFSGADRFPGFHVTVCDARATFTNACTRTCSPACTTRSASTWAPSPRRTPRSPSQPKSSPYDAALRADR
ncbi:XdhC family protein [Streptomyces sp. NPDC059970]|uniref:XdhC family protein n=1 Tax=Streptomyces sp. NPDC059970 TaxID=3347019 RepID=UPI0036792940